jgi:hypothetical protein
VVVRGADVHGGPAFVCDSATGLDVVLVEKTALTGAEPGGGWLVRTCPGCLVAAHLEAIDAGMALVLTHERHCERLAALLAGAGVAS